MRKYLGFVALIFCSLASAQQNNYQTLLLDTSLTENANAIVRLDKTEIELLSADKMVIERRRVITIFNKAGNRFLRNYAHYSSSTELNGLEVVVYNAAGKAIEKIKKKDFKDVSAVSGVTLYEDSRVKYYDYTPVAYPYTVDFSYSVETSNTAFLPSWTPLEGYMVSTEKSEFKLMLPEGTKIRTKEKNFEGYPIVNSSKGSTLQYSIYEVPALKQEDHAPPFYEIEPKLILGLNKFHLEGVDGQADDWETMGQWQYENLLKDRDILPQQTKFEVRRMLQGIDDPIEKARKIYEYVQENTRYISVQLGIGGWRPIEASEVDRVKYGDCKGLTNYTKALLKSQGIESRYSVVWAGKKKKNIEADFASMQGNHVILNIPNKNGDIWLECTSQKIPFGFLGNFTDDRKVLLVSPEGGKIVSTPKYDTEENTQFTSGSYQLNENGSIEAGVQIISKGIQYYDRFHIQDKPQRELDIHFKNYWDYIDNLHLDEINIKNDRDNIIFTEEVKFSASDYLLKMGEQYLFVPNALNRNTYVPHRYRNRKFPLKIERGFSDNDEYEIHVPKSYTVSFIPEDVKIKNEFGEYYMNVEKLSDTTLKYNRHFKIYEGQYPKEKYKDYRNFLREVSKHDNAKIVLGKQ